MKKFDEEIDRLSFYMNYFIVMIGLNARIHKDVSKHKIYSFDEFKNEDLQINSHHPYKTKLDEWKNKFPDLKFA